MRSAIRVRLTAREVDAVFAASSDWWINREGEEMSRSDSETGKALQRIEDKIHAARRVSAKATS